MFKLIGKMFKFNNKMFKLIGKMFKFTEKWYKINSVKTYKWRPFCLQDILNFNDLESKILILIFYIVVIEKY